MVCASDIIVTAFHGIRLGMNRGFRNDIIAPATIDAMKVQRLDEQRAVADVRDDDRRVQSAGACLRKSVPADLRGGGIGQPGLSPGGWRNG